MSFPTDRTVGFIGLGRMGEPIVRNLLAAGVPVVVFDIDSARCALLKAAGATVAASNADVARKSAISFTMVMNDAILRSVVSGPTGILSAAGEGHLWCDLSTVSIGVSEELAELAATSGVRYLCCKVAGSVVPAQNGTLTVFASGSPGDYRAAESLLQIMASRLFHVGTGHQAVYLKLVHSAIVGIYSGMIGEVLALGEKGGVEFSQMIDILEGGPLGSAQMTLKAPVLHARDFHDSPPSDVNTAAKDLDLVLDAGRHLSAPLPLTAAIRQMMAVHQSHGGGRGDIYSILETFERLADVTPTEGTR